MRRWWGAALAVALIGAAIGGVIAPAVQEARTPERWRAARWETGVDGERARQMAEHACGPFVADAWLDFPEAANVPLARDATPEFAACFAEEVAPAFARDRLPR